MNIIDDGDGLVVEFKSWRHFYEKERKGLKCNTVRMFLDQMEESKFLSSIFELKNIRIINVENKEMFFTRRISDISVVSAVCPALYIISWRHEDDECSE